MPFRAYYRTDNGRLVSVATEPGYPETTPEGLAFVEYQANLADVDVSDWMWDEAQRAFVPRPAAVLIDRLQDIIENSDYADDLITLWQSLNATRRQQLRNGLIRLLGRARYRTPLERVTIDPEN